MIQQNNSVNNPIYFNFSQVEFGFLLCADLILDVDYFFSLEKEKLKNLKKTSLLTWLKKSCDGKKIRQ